MLRVSQWVRISIVCAAAMLLGRCGPASATLDLDAIASRYIQLVQELARHDPSLIDHWLVEPPTPGAEGRRPVALLQREADRLAADTDRAVLDVEGLGRTRAEWLQGQARAQRLAAARLLGDSMPFDAEARLAFGLSPERADRFQVDRTHEALGRELPGNGPLQVRLAAFRERFQVPADARDAVMRAAIDACDEVARPALGLPDDGRVDVGFVDGLPWDAHARYEGGHRTHVDLNGSEPLDLSRALRLACHEGSAGHHAQHIWAAEELAARLGWRERGMVPGFGPALLIAEGAAELGAELAMPGAARARVYESRLAPAAGLHGLTPEDFARLVRIEDAQAAIAPLINDVAREYLDNRITATVAAERLEGEALLPGAEGFVFFIERRRTRILAYTEGRRLARERLGTPSLSRLRTLFVP
jgi:hypothetical protein